MPTGPSVSARRLCYRSRRRWLFLRCCLSHRQDDSQDSLPQQCQLQVLQTWAEVHTCYRREIRLVRHSVERVGALSALAAGGRRCCNHRLVARCAHGGSEALARFSWRRRRPDTASAGRRALMRTPCERRAASAETVVCEPRGEAGAGLNRCRRWSLRH